MGAAEILDFTKYAIGRTMFRVLHKIGFKKALHRKILHEKIFPLEILTMQNPQTKNFFHTDF